MLSLMELFQVLLSHFHSDHYMGLSKNWNLPIYCSKITANLIVDILNVDPSLVSTLELNCPIMLTENTTVILYDANHCPGACIFLFTIYKDGDLTNDSIDNLIKYLHTGDFRANNNHISILKDVKLDILYLDDTYLNPSHKFPPQKQVLDAINSLAATLISGNKPQEIESKEDHKSSIALMTRWLNLANPLSKIIGRSPVKILFLVGSYTIGKERVFVSLAQSLQSKIYVSGRKYNVLSLLDDENITSLLTKNKTEADVHVVGMNQINKDFLLEYLSSFDSKKYTNVVMIKPTGM